MKTNRPSTDKIRITNGVEERFVTKKVADDTKTLASEGWYVAERLNTSRPLASITQDESANLKEEINIPANDAFEDKVDTSKNLTGKQKKNQQ